MITFSRPTILFNLLKSASYCSFYLMIVGLCFLSAMNHIEGTEYSWDAILSDIYEWDNPYNWSPVGIPSPADDVNFHNQTPHIDLDGDRFVRHLVLDSDFGPSLIGGQLILEDSLIVRGGGYITVGGSGNDLDDNVITLRTTVAENSTIHTSDSDAARLGLITLNNGKISTNGSVRNDIILTSEYGELDGEMSGFANLFSGNITGDGRLIVSGEVELTGLNTYQGGTEVTGHLVLSSDINLGAANTPLTLNGGTIGLAGSFGSSRPIYVEPFHAGLRLNDHVLIHSAAIIGSGGLEITDDGTFRMTGPANDYTGKTDIRNGILVLDKSGAGPSNDYGAAVRYLIIHFGGTARLERPNQIHDDEAVDILDGTLDLQSHSETIGELNLNGGTVIGTGQLTIGTDIHPGGGLITSVGSSSIHADIAFGLNSVGQIDVGNGTLCIGGRIQESGVIHKWGNGILLLDTENSFSRLEINQGSVQGNTNTLPATMTNHASLEFNQDFDGTFAGNIIGTGSLFKSGSGIVTLTGTNSYSDGTNVSGGSLQGDTNGLQGNIRNNANVTFSQLFDGCYSGAMSGLGALAKRGSGNITFTGNSNFDGTVRVEEGGLRLDGGEINSTTCVTVGNDHTGSLAIAGGGAIRVDHDVELGVVSSGSGTISVYGSNSVFTAAGDFHVGVDGIGLFDQSNGMSSVSGGTVIGPRGILLLKGGTFSTGSLTQGTGQLQHLGGELVIDNGTLSTTTGDYDIEGGTAGSESILTLRNGANWSQRGLVSVALDQPGTLNVFTGSSAEMDTLFVGRNTQNAVGTIIVRDNGSQVTVNGEAVIGVKEEATLDVIDGAVFLAESLRAGSTYGGDGDIRIVRGGQLNIAGNALLGRRSTSFGRISMGDPNSAVSIGGNFIIGDEGPGRHEQSEGTTVIGGLTTIGSQSSLSVRGGSFSTHSLTQGSGQLKHVGGEIIIDAGTLSTIPGDFDIEGGLAGLESTLTLRAGAHWNQSGLVSVALDRPGTLNVRTGSSAEMDVLFVGRYTQDAVGTVTVGDNGSQITVRGEAAIGVKEEALLEVTENAVFRAQSMKAGSTYGGYGDIRIVRGGQLNIAGNALLGRRSTSFGQISMGDPNSSVSIGGNCIIGDEGPGRYEQSAGMATIAGSTSVGPQGEVTIAGGIFDTNAIVNTDGGTFSLASGTVHACSIVGFLDYTGGILNVASFSGNLYQNGGTITIGDRHGVTHVSGNFSQDLDGRLAVDIGGIQPVDKFDVLAIEGTATLGGSLEVEIVEPYTPSVGDTYEILTAAGGLNGTFSTEYLPLLGSSLFWNVEYGTTSVVLEVVSSSTADFDQDSDVDGNDFLTWQTNFGSHNPSNGDADIDGDVDRNDFMVWQSQFGVSPIDSAGSVVPEPASILIMITMLPIVALLVRKLSLSMSADGQFGSRSSQDGYRPNTRRAHWPEN